MINNRWFCEPNSIREPYCFLILYKKKKANIQQITGWRIGYGNIEKIIINKKSKGKDETDIIKKLLKELFYCRKKKILIITDKEDNFSILRTRIAALNIKEANLTNIIHISLEKWITNYFKYNDDNNLQSWCKFLSIKTDDLETRLIKNIFQRIAPLIPRGELL